MQSENIDVAGIARATQKGMFLYHPPKTVKSFQVPVLIPCGSRRELNSAVGIRICFKNLQILRNKRKTAKTCICKTFAKLGKTVKTLMARIAKIAKIELQCESILL